MKRLFFITLIVFGIPNFSIGQIFVSDSVRRFSTAKNEIIETLPDTTYTIERFFKTINISHRKYGMSLGTFKCIDEVKWSIIIEKKSLSKQKGNTKYQIIEGWLGGGFKKHEKVAYDLVDKNNDGEFESLEFTMIESMDEEKTIFCHLK